MATFEKRVNVEHVAKRWGVSTGTIYRLYDSCIHHNMFELELYIEQEEKKHDGWCVPKNILVKYLIHMGYSSADAYNKIRNIYTQRVCGKTMIHKSDAWGFLVKVACSEIEEETANYFFNFFLEKQGE